MRSGITCKQAVDYISKKEEGRLSATMRFQLWKHMAICSLCRIFASQNKIMVKAFGHDDHATQGLTVIEKEALIKAVIETDS